MTEGNNPNLERIVKKGGIFVKTQSFDPVTVLQPLVNGNNTFLRTEVEFRDRTLIKDSSFILYGDIPQDVLEYMRGRAFILDEYYERGDRTIPILQKFRAFSSEDGTFKEYKFER